jgi:ATP-binding cassette subfamily B protein
MQVGDFSIGDFALFTAYWMTIANFTDLVGTFFSAFQQTRVSLERLYDLMDGSPTEDLVRHEPLHLRGNLPAPMGHQHVGEPLQQLEVRNLSYHFSESGGGIADVSFTVQSGTFTVITGRIGSGKSTLLRVMLGLLPKDEGAIRWNGQSVDDPATFFVPQRSAYTGQIPHLFSDTVRNNILLGQMDTVQDVTEAVRLAVVEQDLTEMKQGLETVVGPRGVKLSGGQVQRVAAARMFASQAQLYLFDDISSALDVETENVLWNRLFARDQVTCMAVSNRRVALQQADQIILMRDGRVEGVGTLEELLERSEEMRQIYGPSAQTA